jgi:hypothetical protein
MKALPKALIASLAARGYAALWAAGLVKVDGKTLAESVEQQTDHAATLAAQEVAQRCYDLGVEHGHAAGYTEGRYFGHIEASFLPTVDCGDPTCIQPHVTEEYSERHDG